MNGLSNFQTKSLNFLRQLNILLYKLSNKYIIFIRHDKLKTKIVFLWLYKRIDYGQTNLNYDLIQKLFFSALMEINIYSVDYVQSGYKTFINQITVI